METFATLLDFCEGNPPVNGGFPLQRPATRSFDFFVFVFGRKFFSVFVTTLHFTKLFGKHQTAS